MEYEPSAAKTPELVPDHVAIIVDRRRYIHGSFHHPDGSIAVRAYAHIHASAGAISHPSAAIAKSG